MPVKEGMRDRLRREADADRQALGMAPLGPFRPAMPPPGAPTPAGAITDGGENPPASAPPDPGAPPPGELPVGDPGTAPDPALQSPPSDPPAPSVLDPKVEASWEKRYGDLRAIVGPLQQEVGAMRRDMLKLVEEKAALTADNASLKGRIEQMEAAATAGQPNPRAARLESLKTLYPEVAEELAELRTEVERRSTAAPNGHDTPPAPSMSPGPGSAPSDAISEVLAAHPDAYDLAALPNGAPTVKSAPFWAWMSALPAHLQDEYRPYILNTQAYPAASAIRVLNEFKAYKAPAPAPAAPPAPPKPSDRSGPQGRMTTVDPGKGGFVKATDADLEAYRKTLHKMTPAQKEEKRAWFRASGLM